MSTRPPGEGVYELLVTGDDQIGVLNKITAILSKENVNFVSNHGQVDEAGTTFVNAFFCDMTHAKVSMDALKKELMSLPFVAEARSVPMKGLMFEGFMFPLKSLFASRVINVDAAGFAEMEDRLVDIFGTAGETMAFEQGKAYAESTVGDIDKYRVMAGAEWDLANVQDLFRAQGWGVVSIKKSRSEFAVRVKDPPLRRKGDGKHLGKFLVGMVVGMLERLSEKSLAPSPPAYDPKAESFEFVVSEADAEKRGTTGPSRAQTW